MTAKNLRLRIFKPGASTSMRVSARIAATVSSLSPYSTIILIGSYLDAVGMLNLQGGLINFEEIEILDAHDKIEGQGQLQSIRMSWGDDKNNLIHEISSILISKVSLTRNANFGQRSQPRQISYQFRPRITDWPSSHMLVYSFEGTITRLGKLSNLKIRSRTLRITFSRYYSYAGENNDGTLVQSWLPAISVRGIKEEHSTDPQIGDLAVIRVTMVLVSFYFGCGIWPVSKYVSGKTTRQVYWPVDVIDTVKHEFRDFSIHPELSDEFFTIGFENLLSSGLDVDRLAGIVGRFVDGIRSSSFESKVTYITEAIEGLISFTGIRLARSNKHDLQECLAQINEIVGRHSSSALKLKKVSLHTLVPETTWDSVKHVMLSIYEDDKMFLKLCLSEGRFFKIRNEVVHQGKEASDENMFLQVDIAAHIFRLLFCYVVGCSHMEPMPGHSLEYAHKSKEAPSQERVTMWE